MDSFFNYEYSNGDCRVTNNIEPADDIMSAAAVLRVACVQVLLIEPSVNIPYRYITPKNSIYL
jgi:hypothetical protein